MLADRVSFQKESFETQHLAHNVQHSVAAAIQREIARLQMIDLPSDRQTAGEIRQTIRDAQVSGRITLCLH